MYWEKTRSRREGSFKPKLSIYQLFQEIFISLVLQWPRRWTQYGAWASMASQLRSDKQNIEPESNYSKRKHLIQSDPPFWHHLAADVWRLWNNKPAVWIATRPCQGKPPHTLSTTTNVFTMEETWRVRIVQWFTEERREKLGYYPACSERKKRIHFHKKLKGLLQLV